LSDKTDPEIADAATAVSTEKQGWNQAEGERGQLGGEKQEQQSE